MNELTFPPFERANCYWIATEFWTFFENYAFDDFFDYKYQQWLAASQDDVGLWGSKEELAAAFAAQWAMIPVTRAMDTLVINLAQRSSTLKDVLMAIYEKRQDFIEWITID